MIVAFGTGKGENSETQKRTHNSSSKEKSNKKFKKTQVSGW